MEREEPIEETLTVRLPAEISLTYEFKNPFKDTVSGRTKFSIDVKIYLTNQEAETLDRELIDIMLQALNTIFEARKLEQDIDTLTEDLKQVLDADPA
jgi:hypothetical protein